MTQRGLRRNQNDGPSEPRRPYSDDDKDDKDDKDDDKRHCAPE